jgi:hypothetical protein
MNECSKGSRILLGDVSLKPLCQSLQALSWDTLRGRD